ncbi:MAG: tRNA threonylcarbamoyladenosine dehydratase [Bacilli bacterium]|nr:tRNA threonylcarbamoyladenosine dehydratase [Bacilli bacterium]
MFERLIRIIGQKNFECLQQQKILLVGVGGVGGYALEALVRSGIRYITIVDGDHIEETNLNRQIIATQTNIGCDKVMEARKRALLINPSCVIESKLDKLKKEEVSVLLQEGFDYVIDACDDINVKVELIKVCHQQNIKIVSCMGTGNRIFPEELMITALKHTKNDPLAKKIRSILNKENVSFLDVDVVWSRELPVKTSLLGTVCSVPMSAGSLLASYVIRDVLKQEK